MVSSPTMATRRPSSGIDQAFAQALDAHRSALLKAFDSISLFNVSGAREGATVERQHELPRTLVDANAPPADADDRKRPSDDDRPGATPARATLSSDRLLERIANAEGADAGGYLILGEGGTGKSQLLAGLAWRLARDLNPAVAACKVPVHIDLPQQTKRVDDAATLVAALCQAAPLLGRTFGSERALDRLVTDGRLVLLLDGLDECGDDDARQALQWALVAACDPNGPLAGVRLILATRLGYEQGACADKLQLTRLKFDPLKPADVDEYLRNHAPSDFAKAINDNPTMNALVREQPFILALACFLGKQRKVTLPSSAAHLMEQGVRHLLLRRKRVFDAFHLEPALTALGSIALTALRTHGSANESLLPEEMASAVGQQPDARALLRRLVESSGMFSEVAGVGHRFANRVLAEYLAAAALALEPRAALIEAWSAHTFKKEWSSPLRWCALILGKSDPDLLEHLALAFQRSIDAGEDDVTQTLFARLLDLFAGMDRAFPSSAEWFGKWHDSAKYVRAWPAVQRVRPHLRSTRVEELKRRLWDASDDPQGYVRISAADALQTLGAREAIPELIERLRDTCDDPHGYFRRSAAQALGTLGARDAIPDLIERLWDASDDPNGWVRSSAAKALGTLGAREAIPQLIERLWDASDDPQGYVRISAADALQMLGAREAIPELIERLRDTSDDPHGYFRRSAAQALGTLGARDAIPDLIERLWDASDDPNGWVRSSAAKALGTLGAREAIPQLIERLWDASDDPNGWVRRSAAQALGPLGAREAIPQLIERLRDASDDPDGLVCASAAEALGMLGAWEAVPDLIKRLWDTSDGPSGDVRRSAALALGTLGAREAIPHLIERLRDSPDDPHDLVRRSAAEALAHIFSKMKPEEILVASDAATAAALRAMSGDDQPSKGRGGRG